MMMMMTRVWASPNSCFPGGPDAVCQGAARAEPGRWGGGTASGAGGSPPQAETALRAPRPGDPKEGATLVHAVLEPSRQPAVGVAVTAVVLSITDTAAQVSSKELWRVLNVIASSRSLRFSVSLVRLYLGWDCSLSAIKTLGLL